MRWTRFFRRHRRDTELAHEIEHYILQETDDNLARGMDVEEAKAAALRKFGNTTAWREAAYDMNTLPWMDTMARRLSYAVRQLRRSPGFATTAILSLALGIGANAAVFQLLNAVRLRSLPVYKPHELAEVKIPGGNRGFGTAAGPYAATNPLWEQIREHQKAFDGIFAWGMASFQVGEGAGAQRARGIYASGGMFSTLGVQPWRGRLFTDEDDGKGCAVDPVVISHAFWQREFGGQDSAIGARVVINDRAMHIVGVTPPEFLGLEVGRGFDLVIPNCARRAWGRVLELRHLWNLNVMGRLKSGWTLEQAAAHLQTTSPEWFQQVTPPDYDTKALEVWRRFRLTASPGSNGVSELRDQYESSLWLLLGITGLVLVIACANLANLLLARAAAREREMAVRLAIGASRWQLVWQLLTESLLLAGAGALCAAGVAAILSRTLVRFISTEASLIQLDLGVDWRMVAFLGAVAVLTCVLFGSLPAIRSARADAMSAMKSGGRSMSGDRRHAGAQQALIVSQIAVSFILLTGAFLFIGSFHKLTTVPTGFEKDSLTFHFVDLSGLKPKPEAVRPLQREFIDRVRVLPGIESVSTSTHLPLSGGSWTLATQVIGAGNDTTYAPRFTWVSPRYFETMAIPFLAGRDIDDRDTATSQKVLVVNEKFVRESLGGGQAVGRSVRTLAEPGFPAETFEIIGVVADTKYYDLRSEAPSIAYVPELQNPQWGPRFPMVVRSSGATEQAMASVRKMMAESYPAAKVQQVSVKKMVDERLMRERLLAWLAGFFGVLAVAVSMIGLYGVISHSAVQRRNEVGIRLALGATRSHVVNLFLRHVIVLLGIGMAVGAAASLALAKSAATLLYDVKIGDPVVYGVCATALAIVGSIASLVPAARAARRNPLDSLRVD